MPQDADGKLGAVMTGALPATVMRLCWGNGGTGNGERGTELRMEPCNGALVRR